MTSLTIENYVKAIYQICSQQEGQSAATGQLAAALEVSPGTVTSMLKTLKQGGLATYTPYEGARLTDQGRSLALRVLRRHRLIELFLVQTLGLTWDEVHEEAEHMEHAVSDRLIDRIDAFLDHPDVDPHGDPIPSREGVVQASDTRQLSECESGFAFRLTRVLDQSGEFLRYLSDAGLTLGVEGKVTARQPAAGTVSIAVGDGEITFGTDAAAKILVSARD